MLARQSPTVNGTVRFNPAKDFSFKILKASRHLTEYNQKETAYRHYQFICQLCNDFLIFDEKENWDRHCNFKGRNEILSP